MDRKIGAVGWYTCPHSREYPTDLCDQTPTGRLEGHDCHQRDSDSLGLKGGGIVSFIKRSTDEGVDGGMSVCVRMCLSQHQLHWRMVWFTKTRAHKRQASSMPVQAG